LAFIYRAKKAIYVNNPQYIVQILQDSLKAIGITPKGVRPKGERPATDYRKITINQ